MRVPRQLQQRVTACIAIMAVLLLFVAPMVSKSLTHHPMMGGMAQTDGAMPQDMHGMAMPAAEHAGHHGMDPAEMIFCGYCELLIHVPLLLWTFVPLLWLMARIARLPCAPRIVSPPLRRLILRPSPRGPPGQPFFPIV
ncbi:MULTISPECIES: DUF2946 domain-containing protein [Serratia]|uniref:DUF2946 domain-containing protein n=1 Tax=Serratia TaxID=613 RepID=UPI001EF7C66B|nr:MULTISPECIES: DUF2946 domain-containing protein [Serratia]MCW7649767.1 DUF2946 domain-containing protein [Serratia bockelmannii]MCW7659697.1 DUF2946 domain-containing protein [Serratia bockelmannii]MCW7679481.1 DUF2946 domain-containing protein [Serratia bockelmannii]MCW7684258.1 DUF2946 domain-containing protein [Serratia bockelmannii]MCW7688890.1 DUF2946 domain-containing protein [Serratia bockelmannii]